MIPVEKNDVNISRLLTWSKKFTVVNEDGDSLFDLFMRIVGDADINRARVKALRASAEIRRKLNDPESDEAVAFIPDFDIFPVEKLIELIVVFSMRTITSESMKLVRIKPPKKLKDTATTEEQEKYQEEVDYYPSKYKIELQKIMEKKIKKLRESLTDKPKDFLYSQYKTLLIDELCEQELIRVFKDYVTFAGSFKDEELSIPFFSSFEEFQNIDPFLKAQFISTYSELEISMDDLKKLRGAMP